MSFMTTFNPDRQARYCEKKTRLRCFTGTAPTMQEVSEAYGDNVAAAWMQTQLADLALFLCGNNFPEKRVLDSLADMLVRDYGGMKATEWMLFFYLVKVGEYGRFYGGFDVGLLTDWLRQFLLYRKAVLDAVRRREEEEERNRRFEERIEEHISFAEYRKRHPERRLTFVESLLSCNRDEEKRTGTNTLKTHFKPV